MDNVQFEEPSVIPRSDKHKKPEIITGMTRWLVDKGMSKQQANVVLLIIFGAVAGITLFLLLGSTSNSAESDNKIPLEERPENITN